MIGKAFGHAPRTSALFLSLVLLLAALTGCGYTAIEPEEEDVRAVGTVGTYTVYYDELYHLTMLYKDALCSTYGEGIFDDEETRALYEEELQELVYAAIVEPYAVLELSEEIGYGEADVQTSVDEDLEALVESLGGMHAYKKMLYENYMTDRYVRFTYAVDALESNLLYSYVNYLGIIESDAETIYSIIMEDDGYVRTRHIAVFKDNGKSDEENRALMASLKAELDAGADFDTLVNTYGEDEAQDFNGYYFMKGEMPSAYESAAFALSVGETSDVVETEDAFFLIRRAEKQKEYVLMNCYGEGASLYDNYQYYTFLSLVDARSAKLEFFPNAYGKSLELASFTSGVFFDLTYTLEICGFVLIGLGVAALAGWWVVLSVRADRAEREKRKSAQRKKKSRR